MMLDGQRWTDGCPANGLVEALAYRFELHQAQGMVMVQLGIGLGDALAWLRAYAYMNDRLSPDVARDIVTRIFGWTRTEREP